MALQVFGKGHSDDGELALNSRLRLFPDAQSGRLFGPVSLTFPSLSPMGRVFRRPVVHWTIYEQLVCILTVIGLIFIVIFDEARYVEQIQFGEAELAAVG